MNFHLAKHYILHQLKAKNAHGLHSPFVFELYDECLNNQSQFYPFRPIETIRKKLLQKQQQIEIQDFGAGSKKSKSHKRSIQHIAKNSLKPAPLAQQLFRMIHFLKPNSIIELGTSLGITSAYLCSANHETFVDTFEGSPSIASIARKNLDQLKLKNFAIHVGNFDDTLPKQLDKLDQVDFVYIDGNHRYEPTIRYFEWLKEKSHEATCLVFDDIYWSKEMTRAWEDIRKDPDVMITIDTFYFGICFFRTNQPKQHFKLR